MIFKALPVAREPEPDRLTCGAPLRNRTVDLLLTMDRQKVAASAVCLLNRLDTGWRWLPLATTSPSLAAFCPPKCPPNDLLMTRRPSLPQEVERAIESIATCWGDGG
jgi:hypothetical protein